MIIAQPRGSGKTTELVKWVLRGDNRIILCPSAYKNSLKEMIAQQTGVAPNHALVLHRVCSVADIKNGVLRGRHPLIMSIDNLEEVLQEFIGFPIIFQSTTNSRVKCHPDLLELTVDDKTWNQTKEQLIKLFGDLLSK